MTPESLLNPSNFYSNIQFFLSLRSSWLSERASVRLSTLISAMRVEEDLQLLSGQEGSGSCSMENMVIRESILHTSELEEYRRRACLEKLSEFV